MRIIDRALAGVATCAILGVAAPQALAQTTDAEQADSAEAAEADALVPFGRSIR